MLNRRFVPQVLLLSSCLLAGCARSAVVQARVIAPEEQAPTDVLLVKAVDDKSDRAAPEPAGTFRFPEDRGGALLAKVLPPDVPHTPLERSTEPRRLPGSDSLESPSLPLSPPPLAMPRLPAGTGAKPLRPRLVLPETFGGVPSEPRLPQAMSLPAGELTRVPSVDVNKPIPLPILGQPLSDRAPIEDVTVEASSAAAIAATMPLRTQPTPFVRNNLPDPFEFRRPVGMPKTLSEETNPTTGTPKVPRP